MAPHSSTLAWKIPWMEEPCGLQSMGSLRVGHDWATSLSLFTFMHWRRKRQPTPVFLPGESQGRGSLVGCRLWGRAESDTTDATQQQQQHRFTYDIAAGTTVSTLHVHINPIHSLANPVMGVLWSSPFYRQAMKIEKFKLLSKVSHNCQCQSWAVTQPV